MKTKLSALLGPALLSLGFSGPPVTMQQCSSLLYLCHVTMFWGNYCADTECNNPVDERAIHTSSVRSILVKS